MRFVSIDIETTGLNPDEDQILQVAAVFDDDQNVPVDQLPFFDVAIHYERITGNPFALAMNASLIRQIAERCRTEELSVAMTKLRHWMHMLPRLTATEKIVAAGKNFASFDRQFLRRADQGFVNMLHHRSIDPAMFYLLASDSVPPSTDECLRRAHIPHDPSSMHDALYDARQVVRLVRAGFRSDAVL